MCRFNSKQIINHFLNGNILTDFCSKSHELSRVNDQLVINCNDSRHSCLMLIIV